MLGTMEGIKHGAFSKRYMRYKGSQPYGDDDPTQGSECVTVHPGTSHTQECFDQDTRKREHPAKNLRLRA
jgi:hypothetical protein